MDNAQVPDDSNKKESSDINIFLFSNGQVFSPPRKYHLKAEELNLWDATKNFLARSHFGYMHSTIDLYTIDGKKVEGPLDLENNNAYVAVESGHDYQPGGYEQYLMKASKSWIKRYGDLNSNNTSKEKITGNAVRQSEISAILDKVPESAALPTNELLGAENKKSGEIKIDSTITHINALPPKHVEKKKNSLQRSSILRKKNLPSQANDKKTPPIKRKTNSPQKNFSINKITPPIPKKDSLQLKTLYPSKSRTISSQLAFDIPSRTTNSYVTSVTPAFIIPAKLSVKSEIINESHLQKGSNTNGPKSPEHDFDVMNSAISTNDDVTHVIKKHSESDTGQKKHDKLETITENVSNSNIAGQTTARTASKVIEPFSTSVNVGDVINLRLSIELKNNTTDTQIKKNANVTVPLTNNNENWSEPTEKSSQVNMDEMGARNETMKNILDDLNKHETKQKYVFFYCNCCHSHIDTKEPENMMKNQVKNINNQDFIILLPSTKHDENIIRCKCDDELPKFDKSVQTSMIMENVESLNVASTIKNVDQTTFADKTSIEVNNVSQNQSEVYFYAFENPVIRDNECNIAPPQNQIPNNGCQGCKNILKENYVGDSKLSSKDIKISNTESPELTTIERKIISKENDISNSKLLPKESKIGNIEFSECNNMPKRNDLDANENKSSRDYQIKNTSFHDCENKLQENVMLDKSTQTDSHCLLLEARRKKDGHFSFHLPPLQMVKLYQK